MDRFGISWTTLTWRKARRARRLAKGKLHPTNYAPDVVEIHRISDGRLEGHPICFCVRGRGHARSRKSEKNELENEREQLFPEPRTTLVKEEDHFSSALERRHNRHNTEGRIRPLSTKRGWVSSSRKYTQQGSCTCVSLNSTRYLFVNKTCGHKQAKRFNEHGRFLEEEKHSKIEESHGQN